MADKKLKSDKKTIFSIKQVPTVKVGEWTDMNGRSVKFTVDDLDNIAKNTNALLKTHLLEPFVKLEHSDDQLFAKLSGMPNAGLVVNAYRIGDVLFTDLEGIPEQLMEWVTERKYNAISPEVDLAFEHPTTKEDIGKVLRAVSFLGTAHPAMKGMGSIVYHKQDNGKESVKMTFAEADLTEANESMKTWFIADVERFFPCCIDFAKAYFAEKKVESLDSGELAVMLTEARVRKLMDDKPADDDKTGHKDDKSADNKPEKSVYFANGFLERVAQLVLAQMGNQLDFAKPIEEQIKDIDEVTKWVNSMVDKAAKMSEQEKKDAEANKDKPTPEMVKLQEEVTRLHSEKLKGIIRDLQSKNREVLLPKFDESITALAESLISDKRVVKFGTTEMTPGELFVKFLQEITRSKTVSFTETASNKGGAEKMALDTKVTEEQLKAEQTARFAEPMSARGVKQVEGLDVSIIAKRLRLEDPKLTVRESLKRAEIILKEQEGK